MINTDFYSYRILNAKEQFRDQASAKDFNINNLRKIFKD
jgi:hypothetical protein